MRTTKISESQFTLDCINKEYEICGAKNRCFNTFDELVEFTKKYEKSHKNKRWFEEYQFKDNSQYNEWKEYFLAHFYAWKPKRISKRVAEDTFEWFSLNYGFSIKRELVNKVPLYNRDGVGMWLERVSGDYFKLECSGDSLYKEYLRVIGDDTHHPQAVDPPGGPYLSVGKVLGDYTIDSITYPPLLFHLKSNK